MLTKKKNRMATGQGTVEYIILILVITAMLTPIMKFVAERVAGDGTCTTAMNPEPLVCRFQRMFISGGGSMESNFRHFYLRK